MSDFTSGQVAFVTGAASGIGLATAEILLSSGITKLAVVDISADSLSSAVSFLSSSSFAKILEIAADCSSEKEVDAAVEKTVKEFGRIDICVNAAGIGCRGARIDELEVAETEKVLGLNLMGVWLCERAQIRQMMKQELRDLTTGLPLKTRGSIVNIGSLASLQSIAGINPYVMAKHGVLGLTRNDAADYGQDGIRVNCVCPGWIHTNMTEQVWKGTELRASLNSRGKMGRWGLPEEVAHTIVFLLSDKASFVTGAAISVDGGYTC